MKKESIIWLGVLNEPAHGSNDVGLGRLHHWVLLIICQDDHILSPIVVALYKESRDILHIIDTTSKLTFLAEVVDTNQ